MSWDVMIQDFGDYPRLEDIPPDFKPQPIGTLASVVERLQAAFPDADFSDPTWGLLTLQAGSIEFNIGDKDPVRGVMLHVRGGEAMANVAVQAAEALGCRAVDCSSSDFLVAGQPAEGFAKWRSFRDQVLSSYRKKP